MEEWVRIEVDGFCLQRLIVPKGRSRLCAFRGFPAGTMRRVRLLKEVQPMREDEKRCLLVHGLDCDGKLYPIPDGACRIEFVGDSLSAGVGLAGAPCLVGAGRLTPQAEKNTKGFFKGGWATPQQSKWGGIGY